MLSQNNDKQRNSATMQLCKYQEPLLSFNKQNQSLENQSLYVKHQNYFLHCQTNDSILNTLLWDQSQMYGRRKVPST